MRVRVLFWLVGLTLATSSSVSWAITEISVDDVSVWGVGPTIDSDLHQPAAAYNSAADHYMVAWSQDDGDAGFRIRTGIVESASYVGLYAPTANVDSGVGQARQVSCAWDATSGLYLVVWSQDESAPGAFEIFGRYVDATNVPVGPPFAISAAGANAADPAYDALDPDVASNGAGGFLVAWTMDDDQLGFGEGNFEIYTRLLPAGSSTPVTPAIRVTDISVGGTQLVDALAPAIAYSIDNHQWGMIFEFDFNPGPVYQPIVDFKVLEADGSLSGAAKLAERRRTDLCGAVGVSKTGLPSYYKHPDIAFDRRERQFLAVWETNQGGEPRIAGRLIYSDYTFGPGPLEYSLISPSGPTVCIARDATVAYSFPTGRFLIGWSGTPVVGGTCPGTREILVREVERDGTAVDPMPTVISSMSDEGSPPPTAVSPVLVASEASHRGLFALWSGDAPDRGGFDAFGQALSMDVATAVDDAPTAIALRLGAVPNPFNPATVFHYDLPSPGSVRLEVYDIRGARVRTLVVEEQELGSHQVRWAGVDDRGHSVASGVYLVRLEHPAGVRTQKIALVE